VKAFASANPPKVKVDRIKKTCWLGAKKNTDRPFDLDVVAPEEHTPVAYIELYPGRASGMGTPTEPRPGWDADTSKVCAGDPKLLALAVIAMNMTKQRSLPPTPFTRTLTNPELVELDASMIGPGIAGDGEGN
jgi:hypothetical protein